MNLFFCVQLLTTFSRCNGAPPVGCDFKWCRQMGIKWRPVPLHGGLSLSLEAGWQNCFTTSSLLPGISLLPVHFVVFNKVFWKFWSLGQLPPQAKSEMVCLLAKMVLARKK